MDGSRAQSDPKKPSSNFNNLIVSAADNNYEDWKNISNLTERRRAQNRNAQRKYREKLKMRLEELERINLAASLGSRPFDSGSTGEVDDESYGKRAQSAITNRRQPISRAEKSTAEKAKAGFPVTLALAD
ncbi:hypothetical protein AYL99_12028 [Fonsecaea erecta]|uniref:BZIP domain-containing protein n=1 Tax=Fonsecaea erecta TaxID=1367422 RepID=A0A178Z1U9_9EURO|nr:hypothetical protein AYL99_12028 [Fonsecaea erecta]OAP53772.1 hypothetical protein AYL99_12028 [Fonsecaea erecta]